MCQTRALLVSLALSSSTASFACSQADERAALEAAVKYKSWPALHQGFARYGHCDDGAIAEGFSESVTTILAGRWNDTTVLAKIGQRDPAFLRFVIRHVDATASSEKLQRIVYLSEKECPPSLAKICSDVLKAAKTAL
jgi:hypothetical protein